MNQRNFQNINENFEKTFVNVVGSYAVLHSNHKLQVNKNLGKTIRKLSEHKNKANKTKLQDDITEYKKQLNLNNKITKMYQIPNKKDILNEQLTAIIIKFQNHPSIVKIKCEYKFQEKNILGQSF